MKKKPVRVLFSNVELWCMYILYMPLKKTIDEKNFKNVKAISLLHQILSLLSSIHKFFILEYLVELLSIAFLPWFNFKRLCIYIVSYA